MDKYNIIEPKDNLADLDAEMTQWLQLPTKFKFSANDDCIRLHGCTVPDYYNFIKIGLINAEDKATTAITPSNVVKEGWSNYEIEEGLKKMEQLMQNPYIVIISPHNNHQPGLDQAYNDYLSLTAKNRRLSDYYSVEIWGVNVRNMYEILKASDETFQAIVINKATGEDQSNLKLIANAESVASAIYDRWNKAVCEYSDSGMIQEAMNDLTHCGLINDKIADKLLTEAGISIEDEEKLFLPRYCTWFTLKEMQELGFDGTIPAEMTNNDYRVAVLEAWNDYQAAPSTTNEKKVLELGWNPYVEPTHKAFKFTKEKQFKFFEEYFLNETDMKISDEIKEMTFKDLNYPIMQPVNELDTDTFLIKKVCYEFKNKWLNFPLSCKKLRG